MVVDRLVHMSLDGLTGAHDGEHVVVDGLVHMDGG